MTRKNNVNDTEEHNEAPEEQPPVDWQSLVNSIPGLSEHERLLAQGERASRAMAVLVFGFYDELAGRGVQEEYALEMTVAWMHGLNMNSN